MTATPMTETNQPTWEGYNGWANYETWNASLWINNTRGLRDLAMDCTSYQEFVSVVGCEFTFDGVRWDDPKIDHEEMDEMMDELHD